MSKRLAPGLIRPHTSGEVIPWSYDFDTETAGFLKFTMPVVYTQAYRRVRATWREHDLWSVLCDDPACFGVFIVNNQLLVKVTFTSCVTFKRGAEPMVTSCSLERTFVPSFQVGYLRTVPRFRDLRIEPYTLCVDHNRQAYIHGEFVHLPDAVECYDIAPYRQLIEGDKDFVYLSEGGVKFG